VKTSSLFALLVLSVGLAACSASGEGPVAPPAASTPGASSAPAASAAPAAPAASGPSLEVTLDHLRIASALGVGVAANVKGMVPQVQTSDGTPLSAAETEVMGTHLTWGDGAQDGSDAGDVMCSPSGPLVPLDQQYTYSHTYAKAGTYTVTFTAGACAPLKDVTKTVSVTVG
jgi:hypothetical protein